MRVCHLLGFRRMMARGITIGMVCTMIAACNVLGWGESLEQKGDEQSAEEAFGEGLDLGEPDTETEAEDDVELEFDLSEPADDGRDLLSGPSDPCPTGTTMYYLWYDHTCVLNITAGTHEIYFEETSEFEPFSLVLGADEEIFDPLNESEIMLNMEGYITSDNDTCPITHYHGSYPLRAEITAQCENGKVDLQAKLERVDFNLQGDCQMAGGIEFPGLSSAPEIDHVFTHRFKGDAYILEVPPGGVLEGMDGVFNCTYLFVLQPAYTDDGVELVPLVPSVQ